MDKKEYEKLTKDFTPEDIQKMLAISKAANEKGQPITIEQAAGSALLERAAEGRPYNNEKTGRDIIGELIGTEARK